MQSKEFYLLIYAPKTINIYINKTTVNSKIVNFKQIKLSTWTYVSKCHHKKLNVSNKLSESTKKIKLLYIFKDYLDDRNALNASNIKQFVE